MSKINTIIEEQIEKVTDEKELWSYVEPLIKDFTTEVAKISIKQILEAEVERLKGMKKKPIQQQISCPDNQIGCLVYHFKEELTGEDKIYNDCIDDQITHLTNIIKEIK